MQTETGWPCEMPPSLWLSIPGQFKTWSFLFWVAASLTLRRSQKYTSHSYVHMYINVNLGIVFCLCVLPRLLAFVVKTCSACWWRCVQGIIWKRNAETPSSKWQDQIQTWKQGWLNTASRWLTRTVFDIWIHMTAVVCKIYITASTPRNTAGKEKEGILQMPGSHTDSNAIYIHI